jgi:integration host factor subunit beta
MTKDDLIEEVSRVGKMPAKESHVIVEAIFDSIVRLLRGGDKVEIRGSFMSRHRYGESARRASTTVL